MHTWLTMLEDLPQSTPGEWHADGQVYFILDQVLHPKALEKLYQAEGSIETRMLFQNSDYAALIDSSPVWISAQANSQAESLAAQLCHDRLSGIAIQSNQSAEDAFSHAQALLTVNSTTHGESLCRFYDPRLWSALALSFDENNQANLFGPWSRVFTPGNALIGSAASWLQWQHSQTTQDAATQQLTLGSHELQLHQEVRWLYWLSQHTTAFANPLSQAEIRTVIDNLQLLSTHGVDEARHLERLLLRLNKQPLQDQDATMSILRSDLPLLQKLEKLETLT